MTDSVRPDPRLVALAATRIIIVILGGLHSHLTPAIQALELLLNVVEALPNPLIDSVQGWWRYHRHRPLTDDEDAR